MTSTRFHDAALDAARSYFRARNLCRISAAYYRDCTRAAIRDVRAAQAATYTVINRTTGETRRLTRAQLDRWFDNRSPFQWEVA